MRDASDRLLELALRVKAPWRTALARRAAARGLHVQALRAAPDDPDVLVELGMYIAAERLAGTTPSAASALAGLGRTDEARRLLAGLPALGQRDRYRLARIAAVSDPQWALELLPADCRIERASCLLSLGLGDEADKTLADAQGTTQIRLLRAAISAFRRDWRPARQSLNHLYQAEGLASVLDETDEALSMNALRTPKVADHHDGPLVSVIIAARNAGTTIDMAIASLQAQTWRTQEILVVDDGSTDDTATRVMTRAARDGRIRLLSNARTPGAYGARNSGVAASRGSLIAWHDADDWAHPERLSRQIGALSGGAASVCGHFRLQSDGLIMSPRVFPLARLNPILTLVRRDVIERFGAFEETRLGADSEFLARVQTGLGRSAVARDLTPLVIAGWSGTSLMSAAETGLSREGLSLRIAYVEAWRRRHAHQQLQPETAQIQLASQMS